MGAQKPRDGNMSVNTNINCDANGMMRAAPSTAPPEQPQSFNPPPQLFSPPLPPPPQSFSPPPPPTQVVPESMNSNNVRGLSYLEQLQQQQQPSPVPTMAEPQPVQQPQQQPVVYNDFSEYERQLRQFTKGN